MGVQRHVSAALTPGKRLDTHCIGGLDGPRGWSERVRKISHPSGFDASTVQPVAIRCTDYAISGHINDKHIDIYINLWIKM